MNITTTEKSMFFAGKWMKKKETIPVLNPQNNNLISTVPAAEKADMIKAIEEAKEGAEVSAALPTHKRIEIIRKAANYIDERQEEYARTIAEESSKTIREARKEVRRCIDTLRLSAEEGRRIHGETIPFDQSPGSENRQGYFTLFPVGIIGAITPFNDPLNLVAHKVGPAIASGNAIIVKPATVTPLSALKLAEAFHEAGLPEKILSVITGKGREVGDILVTHPDVRMISFTGGLETGLSITQKAGIKKISMELGSNSPVIVLEDSNIEKAVEACVSGAFWAAGQNCLGVQRVYIEKGVFDYFSKEMVKRAKTYQVGDKMSELSDMGPLITEAEAKRVEALVKEAIYRGAKTLCGGKRKGAFYQPTILADVPTDATIANEEIFGPVVLLYSVNNLDEAIARANAVNYGLQAGIFTNNLQHAFEAANRLKVGGVMINDSSDYRIDSMPFGGIKGSGLGREGVKFAIEEMTEKKVICFKL